MFCIAAVSCIASASGQKIGVAYDKTVHMVFPDNILYVDLGSETIMASIVEEKPNILRLKAAEKGFTGETNISVVLEGDDIRSFDVYYSDSLTDSVIRFDEAKQKEPQKDNIAEKIHRENLSRITSIGSTHHGVSLILKSLYCNGEFIYIHLEVLNRSFIQFQTEAIVIGTDRMRKIRRGQPSGAELTVEETFGEPDLKGNFRIVIAVRAFDFRDDEVLRIQIFERGGSRHTGFCLDSRTFKRIMEEI